MILGSHNSWSFLRGSKWWLLPFAFMAKCQKYDIRTQYEKYNVRCFDLRVLFKKGQFIVAHGFFEYKCTLEDIERDLDWLNKKGDVYVRILHEVRRKKQYTSENIGLFKNICEFFSKSYKNIKFWCGRNLYNWEVDYQFDNEPTCHEDYSSVSKPKYIDDWFPYIYAKINNKKIKEKGTDKDILLIDFVNL